MPAVLAGREGTKSSDMSRDGGDVMMSRLFKAGSRGVIS